MTTLDSKSGEPGELPQRHVTPAEFAAAARAARWDEATVRLILTARLPGMPVVYPSRPCKCGDELLLIVAGGEVR